MVMIYKEFGFDIPLYCIECGCELKCELKTIKYGFEQYINVHICECQKEVLTACENPTKSKEIG